METIYSVAIRQRANATDRFYDHSDFEFQEIKLNSSGRYWIADPFVYEKNDKVYLFYEAYDIILDIGRIAYSVVDKDGKATRPRIIIEEPRHFSFPYIFEQEGEIYIMPESCDRNVAQLYRAVEFPDKWVKDKILIQDEYVVDSILLDESNTNTILGSVQYRNPPEGKVISCWVKNVLFEYCGDRVEQRVLCEGEYGIRNAGKIFYDKSGNRIRPGQNCEGGEYGKGLVFWHLENDYSETKIYQIDAEEMQNHIRFSCPQKIIGTHTYNASEHYEVIDFSCYSHISVAILLLRKIYRLYRAVLRKTKRITNYIKKRKTMHTPEKDFSEQ